MKFINSVPQFECNHDKDNILKWANEKLREAFTERVCVKCKYMYFGEYEEQMICNSTALHFVTANQNPETFSCAAWAKKEG